MCHIYANQALDSYEPVTRRLRLNGHSTSVRLERGFWAVVDSMAAREGISTPCFVSRLHDEVLDLHGQARNFASLLRCACLVEAFQAVCPAEAQIEQEPVHQATPSYAFAAE